jgi:hypothetical protein
MVMFQGQAEYFHSWDVKVHGKPTPENLKKRVTSFIESLGSNGVNKHIGYKAIPDSAEIVDQFSGEEKATWKRVP